MRLLWRAATKADQPALERIQQQMNEQLGKDFEAPKVDSKGIFLAMVAERDGEVVGCWYTELVAELKFCTLDPQVTGEAKAHWWEPLCLAALHRGISFIQVPVPKEADPRVGEALQEIEMYRSENNFFVKDLRK